MTQERTPQPSAATVPEIWGRFVAEFSEHATDTRPQPTESHLARRAFAALGQHDTPAFTDAISRLQANTGGRSRIFRPYGSYLKAIQERRPTLLERHALYDNSLDQLRALSAEYRGEGDKKIKQRLRGRISETVTSALIARMTNPKVTLFPSLHMQDASTQPSLNHDFLFVDTSGEEPYAQPAQIKYDATRAENYDPSIAIITATDDLHVCTVDTASACFGSDCVARKTARYLLVESPQTPHITQVLDSLTNGLLIKLSTWNTYQDEWSAATRGNREAILKKRRRALEEVQDISTTEKRDVEDAADSENLAS